MSIVLHQPTFTTLSCKRQRLQNSAILSSLKRQEDGHVESQLLLGCFVSQQSMKIVTPLYPVRVPATRKLLVAYSRCCGLASMHASASPLRRPLSCEHGELSTRFVQHSRQRLVGRCTVAAILATTIGSTRATTPTYHLRMMFQRSGST